MNLAPWDPLRNLISLQDRMNRLFDESMHRQGSEGLERGTWMPPVDIYETESEIVLVAEIPGMDEKDVEVEVRDNILLLRGERKMENDVNKESYHRVERAYGGFQRSFTLPQSVDSGNIIATYSKGVLEIKMPKTKKVAAQQIRIVSG